MKRTQKNIVMIIIAILLLTGMCFTSYGAGSSLKSASGQPPVQTQQVPDDQNTGDQNASDQNTGDQSSNTSESQKAQPPEKPDASNDSGQPPAGDPPEKPDGESEDSGSAPDGQPPAMPGNDASADTGSDSTTGDSPQTSDSPQASDSPQTSASAAGISDLAPHWFILLGAEGLAFALILMYLILSKTNKLSARQTFRSRKRIAAFIIAAILIGGGITAGGTAFALQMPQSGNQEQSMQMPGGPGGSQETAAEATGANTVDGTEEALNGSYTSSNDDENVILVTNGGRLTSEGAVIDKASADSSNTESSDFSGVNSALLAQENSSAEITDATITTNAKGANAVFATGENAVISIKNSTIETSGEASSRGLDATYGGTIHADNVKITTQGGSCAAMATDRGEGTVTATKSELETNGAGSPLIYSTGDITLTDSKGTANGAQITVVEGKNSATVENSTLTCSAAGNRGDVDIAGVMIYQSMSGDADEGTGNFKAKGSSLTISDDSDFYETAPMFFVTNTDAVIDLEDTELNFGSGILLSAKGTDEWGNEGENGGDVTFNAKDQTLQGDIQLDNLSSLDLTLTGSSYAGTINGDNTASSVSLTLDASSSIRLTGDSYVSSLEDADADYSNIDFNGFTLYVDGKAVN